MVCDTKCDARDTRIEKTETRPIARPQACACEFSPAVDIVETPEAFVLTADIPGADADHVDIAYERGKLTLLARVAERRPENARYIAREFGVGDFRRTFQIGEGIDASRIDAEFAHGVLTLRLPKTETARTRKIAVKAGT